MARLKDLAPLDLSLSWARALWRASAPCFAVMLLLLAWSAFIPANDSASDLSQDLDNTVLAAVETETPADSTW